MPTGRIVLVQETNVYSDLKDLNPSSFQPTMGSKGTFDTPEHRAVVELYSFTSGRVRRIDRQRGAPYTSTRG